MNDKLGKQAEQKIKEWLDRKDAGYSFDRIPDMECWKYVVDNPNYQVSNLGHVRSVDRLVNSKAKSQQFRMGVNLKIFQFNTGYCYVIMQHKNRSIHRLVAQAFIPNSDNKQYVNHKDGNKLNNCVDNLEWVTAKENTQHAIDTGLMNISNTEHMKKMGNIRGKQMSKKILCVENAHVYDSIKACAENLQLNAFTLYGHIQHGINTLNGYHFKLLNGGDANV